MVVQLTPYASPFLCSMTGKNYVEDVLCYQLFGLIFRIAQDVIRKLVDAIPRDLVPEPLIIIELDLGEDLCRLLFFWALANP